MNCQPHAMFVMYVILSDRAVSSTCMHADANLKNVINDDCNVTDQSWGE